MKITRKLLKANFPHVHDAYITLTNIAKELGQSNDEITPTEVLTGLAKALSGLERAIKHWPARYR